MNYSKGGSICLFEDIKIDLDEAQKHLKIHKKVYPCGGVNGGILLEHIMALKHGIEFLQRFLEVFSPICYTPSFRDLVAYMRRKIYSLRYLKKEERLFMKLEEAYATLREIMKKVIMKPGTNKYVVLFPDEYPQEFESFIRTSSFLSDKIKKLLTSDCKADQISPIMKELVDIGKLLSLLEPLFEYKYNSHRPMTQNEKEKSIFTTVSSVLDRALCFMYLSCVGKMDDKMVLSLKDRLSDLIVEETEIMKMYLGLDVDSVENLKTHIFMSLRLLEWNKRCYLGTKMEATLKDHFMNIKHGLKFLVHILEISTDINLKLRIQHLVAIMKQKLYSLPHNQEDENLIVNVEHAYGELREEMQNVFIKQGPNGGDTLFSEISIRTEDFSRTKDFLIEKIGKMVTSSCKAVQMIKELEELIKKLTLMKPLFDHLRNNSYALTEEKIIAALTTFLDRVTCLIYLTSIGNLNEDMLVSVKKTLCLLIEETEIKEISLGLGIHYEDDIYISLSLLKMQEEYHIDQINEVVLKDHIISLEHGIEFLSWLSQIYTDTDLERRITLLSGNVKQKLKSLTYKRGDESINMVVNDAYGYLREELNDFIINPTTDIYLLIEKITTFHFEGHKRRNMFLLEKITTLVISKYKADLVAPLMKDLHGLWKMLTLLKPLGPCIEYIRLWRGDGEKIIATLLTIHRKATFLIFFSFVRKMDMEMVLSVETTISTFKEIDLWEIYTMILNEDFLYGLYLEKKLHVLENIIFLFKRNVGVLNDACSKLYEVLNDIHIFLLSLSPNVLLRKLHLLQPILGHSVPIFCSCYLEHTEVDNSAELNCVIDLIKYIKTESQEIKLYHFPRVDDYGFLVFFSGYLEDLKKNQEISMKEEIDALYFEVNSLLSLSKVTNLEVVNVTCWDHIINMAYQAEYIIDLYFGSSSRDLGLISSLSKIIKQLKNIRADVHGLYGKRLPGEDVAVTSIPQVLGRTIQVSANDSIVGLKEEVEIIMEYLCKGENKLDVISIVGMAGVGKTTLALSIYNNPSMADSFDTLAWCTVSQSYQNRDLVLSILDQVNAFDKIHRSISDEQELVDHFCRCLKKRRYLIVLDDIWDTKLWSYLKFYLPDDMKGSRIIITTRINDVPDQIGSKVNELYGLSEEKSWELFQKKMLGKESLSDDLVKISRGIVKHCKGLPLSIVIIAGILSDVERTEEKWNQIAESVSSHIYTDTQGKCKAILELSYNHLPIHLRSCFLYMGLFPEDQEISMNHLTLLLIAEGLVRDTKSDVAKKYIDDLIVKNLVIPAKERSRGGVKTFRLHDLLRDLCLDKAKEKHLYTLLDERNLPFQDPRRLIIKGALTDGLQFSFHSIRSLICFGYLEASEIEERIGSGDMMILKVLEVSYVQDIPNISSLVHLRYLALGVNVSFLPSSISKLQNLQILILRSFNRIEVPDFIFDMVKLRHVHISPRASFQVDGNRLENSSFLLENLTFLSNAYISWDNSDWLSLLSGLETLHCVLGVGDTKQVDDLEGSDDLDEVGDIELVDDFEEVGDIELVDDLEESDDLDEVVDLEEFVDIEEVDLEVSDDREESDDLEERDDLEEVDRKESHDLEEDDHFKKIPKLSFSANLTSLKVKNEAWGLRRRFVSNCQLPINLRKLTLIRFFLISYDISKIGIALPHLEVFKIYNCSVPFGYKWHVDDGDFPRLKVLKLRHLGISK